MSAQFKCAHCGETFEEARSDAEAVAEARKDFSQIEMKGGMAKVCDDCYRAFKGWFKAHPEIRIN